MRVLSSRAACTECNLENTHYLMIYFFSYYQISSSSDACLTKDFLISREN